MLDVPSPDDHKAYRDFCDQAKIPYVPGFVQRIPHWNATSFMTPCCYAIAEGGKVGGSGKCPTCGAPYFIRRGPDGVVRALDEDAMIEVDCLHAEHSIESSCIVISVTHEDDPDDERETLHAVRGIARGRVLHKHGRGPWIDEQGNPVPG